MAKPPPEKTTEDERETRSEKRELSNSERRRNFSIAGNRLARAYRRIEEQPPDTPRSPQSQARMQECAVMLLRRARELPDNPDRHPGGADYRAGLSNEPSLSIRLFGLAYAYQRDPSNTKVTRELVTVAIAYYRKLQDDKKAEAAAQRNAQRSSEPAKQGRSGPRRTEPGLWIQPNLNEIMEEATK